MGMMWACFQMSGISLRSQEALKIAVREEMPCLPRCFRWMFETPSGPTADEFFRLLMTLFTAVVEKGGGEDEDGFSFLICLVILRFFESVGL